MEKKNALIQQLAGCTDCTEEEKKSIAAEITALDALDQERDEQLRTACHVPHSQECLGGYRLLVLSLASNEDRTLPWVSVQKETNESRALRDLVSSRIVNSQIYNGYNGDALLRAIEKAPENTLRLILAIDEQEKGNAALANGNYIDAAGYYALASVELALSATGAKAASEGALVLADDLTKAVKSGITTGIEQIVAKITGSVKGGINATGAKASSYPFSGKTITIESKIRDQLAERGWTESEIRAVVDGPPIGTSVDQRSVRTTDNKLPRNDPATVFGTRDSYVVVNDITGEIAQIRNKNVLDWYDDDRITFFK